MYVILTLPNDVLHLFVNGDYLFWQFCNAATCCKLCIYIIRWHNKQPHKHNVHNEGESGAGPAGLPTIITLLVKKQVWHQKLL